VRGLVFAVEAYERATIEAVASKSMVMARKAMLLCPSVGEWETSTAIAADIIRHDHSR
jgi:6-phospho-beta-glucosidase